MNPRFGARTHKIVVVQWVGGRIPVHIKVTPRNAKGKEAEGYDTSTMIFLTEYSFTQGV